MARVLVAVVLCIATATVARAQDATEQEEDDAETTVPPAPPPPRQSRCPYDVVWHDGTWMCHGTGYALGPSGDGILAGAALFGAAYLLQVISTAVSAAQGEHDVGPSYPASRLSDYQRWGYAPLLGPWAKIALAPPNVDGGGATLFVFEGLFELAGVVMTVISLFTHTVDTYERDEGVAWRIVPTGNGLQLDARF